MSINVISAEEDNVFHKLNVNNIIVELPKTVPTQGQKGVWVNIKYQYDNGKKSKIDKLKIQTTELFSYGISKYEETSPPKMSFAMVNRKLREKEDISEDDKMDIMIENETIKMLEDITDKIKEVMKTDDMIKALGKKRDKRWNSSVDNMEIVKRKDQDQENGIDSVYVYAKVVTANHFKTKFIMYDENEEEGIIDLNLDETIEKLMRKDVNCKATAMLMIDSVFVGKEPYLQIKLSEAVISEFVEIKKKRDIIIPARFRNRSKKKTNSATNATNSKLYDSDSDSDSDTPVKTKKIIKDDSDSDSES